MDKVQTCLGDYQGQMDLWRPHDPYVVVELSEIGSAKALMDQYGFCCLELGDGPCDEDIRIIESYKIELLVEWEEASQKTGIPLHDVVRYWEIFQDVPTEGTVFYRTSYEMLAERLAETISDDNPLAAFFGDIGFEQVWSDIVYSAKQRALRARDYERLQVACPENTMLVAIAFEYGRDDEVWCLRSDTVPEKPEDSHEPDFVLVEPNKAY